MCPPVPGVSQAPFAALSPLQPTLPTPTPTAALLCSDSGPAAPLHLYAEKRQGISGSNQLWSEDLHINEIPRRGRAFPGGFDGKESACSATDPGSIPGLVRCPGEGNGNPRISWTEETGGFHEVGKNLTLLRDSHFHFQEVEGASHHVFTAPCAVVLCLVYL